MAVRIKSRGEFRNRHLGNTGKINFTQVLRSDSLIFYAAGDGERTEF